MGGSSGDGVHWILFPPCPLSPLCLEAAYRTGAGPKRPIAELEAYARVRNPPFPAKPPDPHPQWIQRSCFWQARGRIGLGPNPLATNTHPEQVSHFNQIWKLSLSVTDKPR